MIEIKQDNIAKWRVNEYTFSDPQMGIRTITLTVNHPFDWVDGEPVEIADFKDSYVEYDGEQFYITNSKPTAEKDTSSLSYKYTLSFEAGESDFKRRKIRNLAEVGVDNFISQGTSFSLYADITQFVQLLNNNLQYYFGSKWDIVLSAPASDSVMLTINNMFIWDLLIKTYEYYGVRWYIRGNTLYIGQEPEIIDHVFDYGVDGGLVKITRTAQAEQTVNRLIGTGGSRNVPTNYFTNRYSNFPPDPDPISGDVNIKNIMPKVFRDSVKVGTLPYIDYVEDSSLVASDGVKEDALEPNEDIFPSIAGVEVPGLGRIDQIIAVETVAVDDPDQAGYKQTFDIWVKDIQFDLSDDQYTSTVDAKISFTSGYLTGYEFVILAENGKRKVVVDTSKSHNGVSSRYKITLIKSSEELEASGKMLPSVNVNAAPGDSFVIYDINMPQSYVELAEERVQTWLESKLDELKQEKPTYTIEPLDQFFEDDAPEIDGKTIRDKLKSGNKLKINNAKITNGVQELHINQVTIQYGAVLPKYTFVVTDKVNVQGGAVQRLQSSIDSIANRQYFTERELNDMLNSVSRKFLSKVNPDTAKEVITFLKGIIAAGTSQFVNLIASGKITAENIDVNNTLKTQILQAIVRAELQDAILKGQLNSETFTSGFLGSGFRLNKIGENWVLELDEIIVRKTMQIYELIVQRVRYQGGQVLHSPAGGKITSVTNGGTYWRIEHDSPDSFTTGAQVLCQNFKVGSESQNPDGSTSFQGVSVKRYWRLVTSFGKGWFNLSKTDMETGSSEPEVGDEIAVLGHRTDPNQQNAIMIVSAGNNSPHMAYYAGINSYSTFGKEVVREGNLSGIVDADFGQLSGFGLYAQNVFLKGIFRLTNGQLITDFVEDRITLSIADKVDKDQIVASINLSEEGVKIQGDKIQFTGSVSFQSASQEVAQDVVDTAVDNLQIGGTNLIPKSRGTELGDYANGGLYAMGGYGISIYGGDSFRIASSGVTDPPDNQNNIRIATGKTLQLNETYTLSFEARTSSDQDRDHNVRLPYLANNIVSIKTGENFQKYSVTFKITNENTVNGSNNYFFFWQQNQDAYITYLRKIKLEKGNKATDWSPAPEDVQAAIDAAVVKATYWSVKASAPVIYKDAINASTSGTHTPVTVSGELRSGTTTTQGGFITVTPNGGTEAGTASASPVTIAPANGDGKTSYTVRLYDTAAKTTLLDTMTIPVVFKGASGVNAISAVLSNEADVLPASPEGVVSDYSGSGTDIIVYEGGTRLTYGTGNGQFQVSASGSGISVGTPSTVGNTRVYGVASNMTADNATITFTITGKTASGASFSLTKVQAFAKSRTGQKGDAGVSITGVDVEFAKNTSPTTAPTTGWTTTAPAITGTEQLWTRTKTAYSSGNPTYSTPANITPKTGATGTGVESVTEEFAISNSKTVQPTSGWSTTQPTWVQGQYIWSRVKVVYKNPAQTIYTGYAVSSEWEAVNNLQIGGVNLLLNSEAKTWEKWGTGASISSVVSKFGVNNWAVNTITDNTNPGFGLHQSYPISDVTDTRWKDKDIILSATVLPWNTGRNIRIELIVEYVENGETKRNYYNGDYGTTIAGETLVLSVKKPAFPSNLADIGVTYIRVILRSTSTWGVGDTFRARGVYLGIGNMVVDWTPSPQDIATAIADAQSSANAAQSAVDDLDDYIGGAFKDGVIDAAEAKAIEKYINSVNEIMSKAEASYNKVYANTYLEGAAKTNLLNAKINLWGQRDTLLSAINTAIAGGTTTPAQKTAVDNAFATFNSLMSAFQNAIEDANKAIQVKLDAISKGYVDDLQIGGTNLIPKSRGTELGDYANGGLYAMGGYGISIYGGDSFKIVSSGVTDPPDNQNNIRIATGKTLQLNETYTLSFEARTSSDQDRDHNVRLPYLANNIVSIKTGENFQKYSVTFKITNENTVNGSNNYFFFWQQNQGIYVTYLRRIKLEKGNKATDWSPAPEDVQAEIDAANAIAADAQAKANTSKAITDKFGTTIDGGLISTVITEFREADSEQVTAFFSGIQGANKNLPAIGIGAHTPNGNAYTDALAGLAKIIFRHDGTGKIGVFEVDEIGSVKIYDPDIADLLRLEFVKSKVPTVASLMSQTQEGQSVTNVARMFISSGSAVLPNSISVTEEGAELSFSGTMELNVTFDELDGATSGSAYVGVALYKDGFNYAALGNISSGQLSNSNYSYSNSVQINKKLTVPKGVYTIVVSASFNNASGAAGINSTSTLSWILRKDIRRFIFGSDGFASWYTENSFHFSELTGVFARGKVDMPGVLLSASVGINGTFSNWWGAKKHATQTAVKVVGTSGTYDIFHSIGHANYQVGLSPHSNRTYYVGTKQNDRVRVYFYTNASSPSLSDTAFDFQITGNNY